MRINPEGRQAAEIARGSNGRRRVAGSFTSIDRIITAYLEGAGYTEEEEKAPAGTRTRKKPVPVRVRTVGPWEDKDPEA